MTSLDLLISTYEDLYDKYFEQLKKDHPNIRFNEVSHSRFWEFNSLIAVVQEFQTICSEEVRQLFDTLIADVPEIRMTKPVVISIDKMNDAEIQILENVFCRLNVTHLHREPQKYLVYCTEADFEHLKKSIIDEFYKVVKEKIFTVLLNLLMIVSRLTSIQVMFLVVSMNYGKSLNQNVDFN